MRLGGHYSSSMRDSLSGTDPSKSVSTFGTASTSTKKGKACCLPRDASTRAVWLGRLLFATVLGLAAALLGWGSYKILDKAENDLMEKQFHVVAQGALAKFQHNFARKTEAFQILQQLFQNVHSNEDANWPFVTMPGFPQIVSSVIQAVEGCAMAYMPVVKPEQLAEFQDFAYQHYQDMGYPETLAHSSFGKGVWGTDKTLNNTDFRYHDTNNTYYTPVLQHSSGAYQKFLMMNFWTSPSKRKSINATLQCVESRKNAHTPDNQQCTSLADTYLHPKLGPISLATQAIVKHNDNSTVVAYIHSPVSWEWIMFECDESLNGLSFVLTSDHGDAWTWTAKNGTAVLQGQGAENFPPNTKLNETLLMNPRGVYSVDSAEFTIHVLATDEFVARYQTSNPTFGMIGAVVILILTSAFFVFYDWLVRKEFQARQKLLQAKRNFMRFISHEVRTPLNSVSMGLTLLEETLQDDNGNKTQDPTQGPSEELLLVQSIQRSTQSAVDVLNDLLNYDKIEAGTFKLELQVINVWELLETTVNEFQVPCHSKDIALQYDDNAKQKQHNTRNNLKSLIAVADPIRLQQVVRNLLSNAVKFTPSKGGITVNAKWIEPQLGKLGGDQDVQLNDTERILLARNGHLEFSVKDSGAGMTKAQLHQLFQSAGIQFNANKLQGGGGTGLGLYVSKGIVEQHGGTLSVNSEGLQKGTIFTLTLPLYFDVNQLSGDFTNDDDKNKLDNTDATTPLAVEEESGPLRILAVDDSRSNLKLLTRLLEKRGHIVVPAEDGQQAVDRVKEAGTAEERFDIICMDYQMPVMDGPTAVGIIRDLGCDAFIVGVTGNVLPEDIQTFKEKGANAVLPKPFRVVELEALQMEHAIIGARGSVPEHEDSQQRQDTRIVDVDIETGVR